MLLGAGVLSMEKCSYHRRKEIQLWDELDWTEWVNISSLLLKSKHVYFHNHHHYHCCQGTKRFITPKSPCLPLQLIPPGPREPTICFLCLFSLAIKEFSVSPVFSNLIMICLGMVFFVSILLGDGWISSISGLKLENFQPLFSEILFLLLSCFITPTMSDLVIFFHGSLKFCSFLFILFFFVCFSLNNFHCYVFNFIDILLCSA